MTEPSRRAEVTERGRAIEAESFALIDAEAGPHGWPAAEWQVVRRVIHATGDLGFRDLLVFDPRAIEAGRAALRRGSPVVLDVQMILAGLSAGRLGALGCRAHVFISDEDVVAAARSRGTTRAVEAMRKAHRLGLITGAVVAVGNAPTALLEVDRLVREEGARPALVVGVPVGFVAAAESKDQLAAGPVPFIVTRGRKGGSPAAVAILHALLILAASAGPDPGTEPRQP